MNPSAAHRAIYIDLEGTKSDPPSLLGVLYPDDLAPDGREFIQYVWEEGLFPAAKHQQLGVGQGSWCVVSSAQLTFRQLLQLAEGHDRHIVAWSMHERDVALVNLDADDQEKFRHRYVNADSPISSNFRVVRLPCQVSSGLFALITPK